MNRSELNEKAEKYISNAGFGTGTNITIHSLKCFMVDFYLDSQQNITDQFVLKSKFTEEFFEEFQYDAEFRSIFESMVRGLTPYKAIEHLCKSKKELLQALKKAIENAPTKIIVTTETLNQLKK